MIHSPVRFNKFLAFSTIYLFAAALALGVAIAGPAKAKDASTVPALKRVEAKSQAVSAKVLAATVGIINQGLAGGGHMGEGSGVCVSEDGIILTAGHVMGAVGAELTVIFPDGRRCNAKALGANFSRDSGVIKVLDPGKYPYVEMGHSDELKPGAWCMALGHPGGVQQGRTPPIRLGRLLVAGKRARFIVSDATVISGDSGGPLFDLEGRVIGIHSNIGMNVNQNQHVPIDVYHEQWKDLLASKSFGTPRDMPTAENMPSPEKLQKFRELFSKKMMAGDPEVKDLARDGQLRLTPDDIERLLAKWEKEEAAAKKAETVTTSGTAGANDAIDFLKFQRLFQERLLAGDPETLKLVKDGKMMVTPQQMHQLMDLWEGKTLAGGGKPKTGETAANGAKEKLAPDKTAADKTAADKTASNKPAADKGASDKTASSKPSTDRGSADKVAQDKVARDKGAADKSDKGASGKVAGPDKSPAPTPPRRQRRQPTPEKANPEDLAKMRDLMRNAVPLGDGRYGFRGSPDAARELRDMPGLSQALSFGKSSPQILQEVAPIANRAGQSTVVVLCDGKPAVLGTIVRKDGLILTKFSELHGKITCKIGTTEMPATIMKKRNEHDLALLKVDAKDLTPIVWAEGDSPVPGSWLVTPSADNDVLGMGVVSIAARSIADAPSMVMKNRAMVGVLLDQTAKNALVQSVSPGLPAALGGLKSGDIIEKINGEATKLPKDVTQTLTKYKPGDHISVEITRNGKPVKLSMNLVSSDRMAPKTNGENLTRLSEAGGTVSRRHGSFVSAFTHDTVIQSTDCGGPVVNLDGKAVGLNIARVDRTATYAIPASMLRLLMAEMMPK